MLTHPALSKCYEILPLSVALRTAFLTLPTNLTGESLCYTMTLWHHDTMTLWHYDTMTPWHHDTMTLCISDTMTPWESDLLGFSVSVRLSSGERESVPVTRRLRLSHVVRIMVRWEMSTLQCHHWCPTLSLSLCVSLWQLSRSRGHTWSPCTHPVSLQVVAVGCKCSDDIWKYYSDITHISLKDIIKISPRYKTKHIITRYMTKREWRW